MTPSTLDPHPPQKRTGLASGRKVLQELPQIRISYDADYDYVYADWRGPQTLATVREGSELVLAVVAAGKYTKLLNDNTHLTAMNVTSEEWHSLQVLNRLFKAGLQYLAWVYSPDPRGRVYADYSVSESTSPFVLTFEEYHMAAEWLRQY